MTRLILAVSALLVVSGCVSVKTTTTGQEFIPRDDELGIVMRRASMSALAQAAAQTRTLSEVVGLLGEDAPPYVRWEATFGASSVAERYTWRFAEVRQARWGLGVVDSATIRTQGYLLVIHLLDGRVSAVSAETTDLTEAEREWTTTRVISLGVATAGTLLMLQGR